MGPKPSIRKKQESAVLRESKTYIVMICSGIRPMTVMLHDPDGIDLKIVRSLHLKMKDGLDAMIYAQIVEWTKELISCAQNTFSDDKQKKYQYVHGHVFQYDGTVHGIFPILITGVEEWPSTESESSSDVIC